MRWENAGSGSNNEIYHLWHNDKKLLTLTLHPFSNTARLESAEEKRVFLIRREGFFRNKTVLRNEYGIRIGELGTEEQNNFIELNDERFYYYIHNNPAELVLYKETKDKPFIACGFNVKDGNASVRFEKDKTPIAQSSLLMALCWYMFLPVAKNNAVPELAV
ncbi:MAG TPA: hypothetical protein VF476_09915 [Chitinophagaceae bacterium]